jgi:hypothetical protein
MGAWQAQERGVRRFLLAWHRRAGKDDFCMHMAATKLMQKPATYWHMLPQYGQARKAVWDAINPHTGKKRIDEAFPKALRRKTKDHEMLIEFKNGATWQLVGSDSYDSLVGSPPFGVIASEWALANPAAWAYLRPILTENGGWASFISTVRGRNHFHRLYESHKNDPEWFCQVLGAKETGVLSEKALEKERMDYQAEYGVDDGDALFAQEYNCDWNAAIIGSYYGRVMRDAEQDGRIGAMPYDPAHLVHTAWDVGNNDSTAIWMFQVIGWKICVIDYLQNSGQQTSWYVSKLMEKPYSWGYDFLPHDANHKNQHTNITTIELIRGLGRNAQKVLIEGNLRFKSEGIKLARSIIPRCSFDKQRTEQGRDGLVNYRREYDRERKIFHDRAVHDWASHPSDAFRYLALSLPQIEVVVNSGKLVESYNARRRF